MKLIWISDPHFEFLMTSQVRQFLSTLPEQGDTLLFTGDITNVRNIREQWTQIAELNMTTYFVLGNHDYYGGSIDYVQKTIQELTKQFPNLHWIHGKTIKLNNDIWLVGADGWGDGRAGNGAKSFIRLNDSNLHHAELRGLSSEELFKKLGELGDISTKILKKEFTKIFKSDNSPKTILLATHVPPFVESALYENKPSEPEFSPHFVNFGLGQFLLKQANLHPDINFRVLLWSYSSRSRVFGRFQSSRLYGWC